MSVKRGKFKAIFGLLLLTLFFVLLASSLEDNSPEQQGDLARARSAVINLDIGDAEMYFERYLRKNPDGEYRWEVWQSLLEIALNMRNDAVSAREYLEIMLEEFNADPGLRGEIRLALAALSSKTRSYERAVTLWEAVSTDPATTQETLATVYRELSRAYLRRLEFTLSKELLDRCLQLDVAEKTKAQCLYALAEAHMLTDELTPAEKTLRKMLGMTAAGESLRIEAVFMLADVLEQQEKNIEAESLFESLRDSYPNRKVIDVRLTALKNKRAI